MNRLKVVPIIVIGLLLLAGCAPPGIEEAQVEFCQALDRYRDTTALVQDISEQTTVAELNDLRDRVTEARQELLSAATTLHEARLRYAESAWQDWEKQVENVPGDATIGEAAPYLRGQVDVLITEIDRVSNISCERR